MIQFGASIGVLPIRTRHCLNQRWHRHVSWMRFCSMIKVLVDPCTIKLVVLRAKCHHMAIWSIHILINQLFTSSRSRQNLSVCSHLYAGILWNKLCYFYRKNTYVKYSQWLHKAHVDHVDEKIWYSNRPLSQIPQYTRQISYMHQCVIEMCTHLQTSVT